MPNWLGALQGALGGAGAGAGIGGIIPGATPVTAAIGAGIGGLGGGLAGLFGGGEKGGVKQSPTLNPEQMNILQFLLQQGQQGLQNPSAGFGPIARQARNQFSQQTIPSLAERFTSMGNNSLSSPAFASQLGQAGAGLEEALAALQSQYGQQNQQHALSMLALGLSPSFQNFYQGSQPGFGENLLSGAAQAAPSFFQSYLLNNALSNLQR